MFPWGVLMVKGRIYQSNLASSMDIDLLMLVLQMISEIPPVVNSNMRLGIFLFLFKVEHALVELHHYALKVKVAQSCLILCDPMDCSLPASSVHGILQARILEWIAIPFFRGSSWSRDQTQISCIAGKFFTIWATREAPSIPYICINIRYLSVFYLLHSV